MAELVDDVNIWKGVFCVPGLNDVFPDCWEIQLSVELRVNPLCRAATTRLWTISPTASSTCPGGGAGVAIKILM